MKHNIFLLFVLLTVLPFHSVFAGGNIKNGTIKGRIVDQSTNTPLSGASIILMLEEDNKFVHGTSTNNNGEFEFTSLESNKYSIKISFVGFQTKILKPIILSDSKILYDVKQITLEPSALEMNEISITGDKPNIQFEAGKQIINVDKNIISSNGSAVDVLKTSPAIEVDHEGKVSLRGESNVKILIDGKPSSMSGDNNNNILQQIPASAIENIEIITNPSAKYDAEGISGIINVNLKKKMENGLNGMLTMNAGTGDKYNSSLNSNYNTGTFNLFANYDFMSNINKVENEIIRTTYLNDTVSSYKQTGAIYDKSKMHNIKAGLDYIPSPNYLFTLYSVYRYNSPDIGWDMNYQNYIANIPSSAYYRNLRALQPFKSIDLVLNSKRIFEKKGNELTMDLYYSKFILDADALYGFSQISGVNPIQGSMEIRNMKNDNEISTYTAQADYVLPFELGDKFEAGIKGIFRTYNSEFQLLSMTAGSLNWFSTPNSSNSFKHNENVASAYMMYSGIIESFNYQLGLRLEHTSTNSELISENKVTSKNYTDLFPNIVAGYKFSEFDQLQLSYSRRINRPYVWFLNPWVNDIDPLNLRYGNSKLNPEYTNAFELTYTKFLGTHSITPTMFYRYTTDIITQYSFLDSKGIINSTFINAAKSENLGIDLTYQAPIFQWWNMGTTVSYYRQMIRTDIPGLNSNRDLYSWNGRINSTFIMMKELSLQLFALYRPEVITPQGKRNNFYFIDAALKYDFWDSKASVTLRVSDILKSLKVGGTSDGDGYSFSNSFIPDSRTITIGFSYRLNKGPKFTDRKKEPETIQMMNNY